MRKDIILATLSFNALTAIGGGVMLMTGGMQPPAAWLANTVFTGYFIPGLLLAVVVGGSALLAAIARAVDRPSAGVLALLSGALLCVWIIDEIALVQAYSWLQLLYFSLGGLLIGLDYTDAKRVLIFRHKSWK